MSQIELILSRHGETEENKLHIMQGQLPGHLSELGKQQAEALAEMLDKEELDVIIVPDYGLNLGRRFEALELSCERAKFITGPHTPLAGRKYVSPTELAGQTIFRVEGTGDEAQEQPLPGYYARLGLGENPIQRVKTYLEATSLVQAGLGIAAIPGSMVEKLTRDVSVFSIEGDSFLLRTLALRALPPVSVSAEQFFQLIRDDQEGLAEER